MDLGLQGRVYVVTGGTSGLGLAGAQALVADGAQVVIAGRDPARVRTAVDLLGGEDHAVGIACDLADPRAADRLVVTATGAFGRLDGALISVGGPPPGRATEMDDSTWRAAFDTVFLGPLRMAKAVVGELDDGGSIAFVLSSTVRSPVGGLAISNGLRPGLAMLAKDLADELGPRGVRVLSLLPGRVATDRTAHLDATRGDAAAARQAAEASIPLRRYGDPAEFGRVAAFVLSPAASYLTGIVIPVDGGMLRTL